LIKVAYSKFSHQSYLARAGAIKCRRYVNHISPFFGRMALCITLAGNEDPSCRFGTFDNVSIAYPDVHHVAYRLPVLTTLFSQALFKPMHPIIH
jgi:hypothetical protein